MQNNMATLKEIIDYSKANPESDYAKTAQQHIQNGDFDAQAQKEGIDLSWAGRPPLQNNTDTAVKEPGLLSKIGGALISSETATGNDLTAGIRAGMETKNEDLLRNSQDNSEKVLQDHINALKAAGKDSTHAEQALAGIKANSIAPKVGDFQAAVPESTKTNLQGLGDVAGVGLDVLSAGSYGTAAKGAETGKLLVKSGGLAENLADKVGLSTSEKIATPIVKDVAKETLGQTLKTIGKKTAVRAGIGAGTGYAYDVSQNLQNGATGGDIAKPGMGTLLGGTIPLVIGGVQAGVAITKDTAPRFINSLIKPKLADFSYGKDPGRTVSEMGITGNSIDDFANNIHTAKQDIGSQLGAIYSSPANADIKLSANDEISKIDDAINKAAKGGKENQGIVTTLQNTKDALLYEHAVNADGVIEKVGTTPRDLSALSPQEMFDLKSVVADQTKFTGKPSDDKTVNSVLKSIYGGLKETLNNALGKNNPEITDLNQKYADLTSAELATRNRSAILARSNIISSPIKMGSAAAAGIVTAIASGGTAIPVILAGTSAAAVEKAMESTAVKTRIAAWLGSATPSMISKIPPEVKTVLYRLLPKFASQLGKKQSK